MQLESTECFPILDLPPEVLLSVMLYTGDPINFTRLEQVSKALKENLGGDVAQSFWQFRLKQDFPIISGKAAANQTTVDYRQLYKNQWEERKKSSKSEHHRKLFNFIRLGNLEAIKQGGYGPGDFLDSEDYPSQDSNFPYKNALLAAKKWHQTALVSYMFSSIIDTFFQSNFRCRENFTPLHWAAACGLIGQIEALKSRIAINDDSNRQKVAPLYFAAWFGHVEVVKALLAAGADPKHTRHDGASPLLFAANQGHVGVVKVLLAAGADPKQTLPDGTSLLLIAASEGRVEVVKVLLAAGTDPKQTLPDGGSPLYLAAQNGHAEVVKVLLAAGADPKHTLPDGTSPLLIAASEGRVEVVKVLLAAGADPEQTLPDGSFPLLFAANQGHVGMVKVLLAAGANPNQTLPDGGSPLLFAANQGHVGVVKVLLAAGANPNQTRLDGASPLLFAVEEGDVEVVKVLLAADADVNQARTDGATPLFIAAQNGHLEVVKTLLAAGGGIEPNSLDEVRRLADMLGHTAICTYLDLWKIKLELGDKRLRHQVISILNAAIKPQADRLCFFSSDELNIIVSLCELKANTLDEEPALLREFLTAHRSKISQEKFDFIMAYILPVSSMRDNTNSQQFLMRWRAIHTRS